MRRRSRRPHAGPAAPARSRRRRPRRRVRIARTRLRRRRPAPARRRQRRNLFKKRKHIERAMILEGRICVESGTGGGAHHYYYSVQAGSGRLVRLPAKTLRGCPSRGPDTWSRFGGGHGGGSGGGGGGGTRMGPAWGRPHHARWPDPSHPRSESSESVWPFKRSRVARLEASESDMWLRLRIRARPALWNRGQIRLVRVRRGRDTRSE